MVVLACQQGLQIDSLPRNWLPCRNHTVIAVEAVEPIINASFIEVRHN